MKPFFYIVIFCLTGLLSFSQSDTNQIKALLTRIVYSVYQNPKESIDSCKIALEASKKLNYQNGMFVAYDRLADLHHVIADYNNGQKYALLAFAIAEKQNNIEKLARCNNVLGLNYRMLGDHQLAKNCFIHAVSISLKLSSKQALAIYLNNLANEYQSLALPDSALFYYNESLALRKSANNTGGIGAVYNDMSLVYIDKKEFKKADSLLKMSLQIMINIGDIEMQSIAMGNIGNIKFLENNLSEAEKWLHKSNHLASQINQNTVLLENYRLLYMIYDKTNKPVNAFMFMKLFLSLKDSLKNEETVREFTKIEQQNRFEKIQMVDSLQNAMEKKLIKIESEKKLQKQRLIIYGITGFLLLTFLLVVSLFRSNKQKRLANEIISNQKKEVEIQKQIVEEKQKEVLDSIRYAKRIQTALLPSDKYIARNLDELNKK